MALSRTTTASVFYRHAIRDIGAEAEAFKFEKFDMINRAVNAICGLFYGIMSRDYQKYFTAAITNVNEINLLDQGGGKISLMRVGAQSQITIESNANTKEPCHGVSLEQYMSFRTTDLHNRFDIIWTLDGEKILLKKGSSVTTAFTAQTIIVHYPGLPTQVAADGDYIDLPDGPPIDIGIVKLKLLLADRYNLVKRDFSPELRDLVRTLFENFGVQASVEEIEGKVKAIL